MVAFIFLIAAVILLVWKGRSRPVLTRGQWRVGAGLLSIGALVGAALVSIRCEWEIGLGLLAVGLGLLAATRLQRGEPLGGRHGEGGSRLSLEEARSLLGVTAQATEGDIRAAYSRLMRVAHPDRGGTNGLAAQLNAARDRLLGG